MKSFNEDSVFIEVSAARRATSRGEVGREIAGPGGSRFGDYRVTTAGKLKGRSVFGIASKRGALKVKGGAKLHSLAHRLHIFQFFEIGSRFG